MSKVWESNEKGRCAISGEIGKGSKRDDQSAVMLSCHRRRVALGYIRMQIRRKIKQKNKNKNKNKKWVKKKR